MTNARVLLTRLLPLFSVATAAACASKPPTTDVPQAPTTGAEGAKARATNAPPDPKPTGGSTSAAPSPTTTPQTSLTRCRACNQHCYDHGAGEACLPANAGASVDARVGCVIDKDSGPFDDGKRCCYGGPCPGRPLVRHHLAVLATLLRGHGVAGWA